MFKNFEIKFSASTQFLFGYSYEVSGTESQFHSVYIGPWTLTVITRKE